MALQCLIIEDEPLAAEVLTDYIRQVPFLSTAASCPDAFKALDVMRKQTIDVIFLDLHLPGIRGFDLLKTLPQRPQVIVTTAYHQYALQGYEWQVVDYLVKPIEFSRFLIAVNKLAVAKEEGAHNGNGKAIPLKPSFFISSEKKQVRIFTDEILYVESERDYVKIVTSNKTHVIRHTLQEFEKQLPGSFIRIHRSFVINANLLDAFDSSHVEVGGKSIPVGRQYRNEVVKKLGNGNGK